MDRIPILKLGDALLVTIQVDMHDRLATALEEDLTNKIVAFRAKGVLIDISALDVVDSFIGRMLGNIAAMSRILDAETVVVGMQPSVAISSPDFRPFSMRAPIVAISSGVGGAPSGFAGL